MKESYDPRPSIERRKIRGRVQSVVWSEAEYKASCDPEPAKKRRKFTFWRFWHFDKIRFGLAISFIWLYIYSD